MRASTRAVYRKNIADLESLLLTMEGPNVSRDRDRLAALTPHETHLVLVQERNANIRANVVYERLDARGRGRVQVVAELPLLYAHGRRPNPPEVQFPVANRERAGSTTRRAPVEARANSVSAVPAGVPLCPNQLTR